MRDPDGALRFVEAKAIRTTRTGCALPDFLNRDSARMLVRDGLLIPFEIAAPDRIESPRYSFVTLPVEWTDAQFRAAAELTLEASERILGDGFELKDASAWNVIFRGSSPIFCDHFSFSPLASKHWRAFGQFCRHFIFPLACASHRGIHASETLLIERDGLTALRAKRILGLRGFFSPLLPLLATAYSHPRNESHTEEPTDVATTHSSREAVFGYARRALPRQTSRNAGAGSVWSRYVDERSHYNDAAASQKRQIVSRWIEARKPTGVLDVGCNTGEFSRMALQSGADVFALDADHDSVQQVYLGAAGSARLYPIIANIADLHGGRGWRACEFPGLLDRLAGRCDLLLMLAVVHHLHLSESIPLDDIAGLCAQLTTSGLILELVDSSDPMVQRLARNHGRDPVSLSMDRQLAAFSAHFQIVAQELLDQTKRTLVLMQRR